MAAPRLETPCPAHGIPLPLCDPCASVPAMSAWASALSGYALADALETLARSDEPPAGGHRPGLLRHGRPQRTTGREREMSEESMARLGLALHFRNDWQMPVQMAAALAFDDNIFAIMTGSCTTAEHWEK